MGGRIGKGKEGYRKERQHKKMRGKVLSYIKYTNIKNKVYKNICSYFIQSEVLCSHICISMLNCKIKMNKY